MQTVFEYFLDKGDWPLWSYLNRKLYRIIGSSIRDIVKDIVPELVFPISYLTDDSKIVLTVPGMYYCKDSHELLTDFVRVVRLCVEKYLNSEEDKPTISNTDLSTQLNMSEATIKTVEKLLGLEGARIINGGSSSDISWKYYIPGHILLFDGIQSIEQYLEKRRELDNLWNRSINPLAHVSNMRENYQVTQELNIWEKFHPSIRQVAQDIAEAGKFDTAIFEAFRYVEGEIQGRIGSTNIGKGLLNEAFDGPSPKILISQNQHDREGIKELFSGAFSNIRNDRGHKKAPAIPCKNLETCFLYLSFASFLLYLLSKDQNIFPYVESIRIFGTPDQPLAELRGRNFTAGTKVIAQGSELRINQINPTMMEVSLPANFSGSIRVVIDDNEGNEVSCDAQAAKRPEGWREVIGVDIPLYEDAACTKQRSEFVSLLLRSNDVGREFLQIVPTRPGIYHTGYYVTHGPFEMGTVVGESWYRDPHTGDIRSAWSGSAVATPQEICKAGNFLLGGIAVLPRHVETQLGEQRTLGVLGWGKDGSIRKEVDLSNELELSWQSTDSSIAHVNKSMMYPKTMGKTTVECRYKGFVASTQINVGYYPKGKRVVYFQGLRCLQQIRFDADDNLYICNQSASVYRVLRSGGFEEIVRLPALEMMPYGIDCIAVDKDSNLYVNDLSTGGCLRFGWDGKHYKNPVSIGTVIHGTKKSIVVDQQGHVFIAVMGSEPGRGYIIHIEPDGSESYFQTRDMVIYLALDQEGNIYTPSQSTKAIHVYNREGTLINTIQDAVPESPSDILIDQGGAIYLPFFHSGKVLKVTLTKGIPTATHIADGFRTPGGIAMDSQGRLYVSNFDGNPISNLEGNTIEMIY